MKKYISLLKCYKNEIQRKRVWKERISAETLCGVGQDDDEAIMDSNHYDYMMMMPCALSCLPLCLMIILMMIMDAH